MIPRMLVPLPEDTYTPRVGRVRLGESFASPTQDNPDRRLPRKVDYFLVDAEDDVTSESAAQSFHEVYPGEPRALLVQMPSDRIEEVLRGSWRTYESRKMVLQCDGTNSVEKLASGAWTEPGPCACIRRHLKEDNRLHCRKTWALEFVLPDVKGFGIWDIATTSDISAQQLTAGLKLIEKLAGGIAGIDLELRIKPVKVSQGVVYTLEIGIADMTPREVAEKFSGQPPVTSTRQLPPPADDARPDPVLHDAVEAAREIEAGGDSGEPAAPPPELASLRVAVADRMRSLTAHEKARLRKFCAEQTPAIKATRDGAIAAWGTEAVAKIDLAIKES